MPMSKTKQPGHSTDSLAALSHEFRTPLNGVLGIARLLEGTRLTAEQRAYVGVLKQSGDHLLSLVNDLLDLAKLDAGALVLDAAPVDIGQLLQSVSELLSPRAHDKGLEIAWAVPAGMPTILADAGRLRQVLLNLAGNAIKFTETGGALLTVRAVAKDGGKHRLRFIVQDTGPGVAKAQQKRIFQAYTQAEARHAARADSTGLGLAIVQRLAKAHHGKVGVDSAPGQGAVFWFEADFAAVPADHVARPLAGLTVAIASNNSVILQAAQAQIEAAGGAAVIFASLAEAAHAAPANCVVLVDHALAQPRKPLRPLTGHPCLIMVAPEQRARIGRYRSAGFAGYLIKPLRAASLADRVLAAIGRQAAGIPERKDERALAETAPGARVLLVEDNPVNALLARKLLEREGCSVEWVTGGDMALAAAPAGHDLILMDRRMPGLDGLATTACLRAMGIAAPIVALTADAFEEDRRACLAAGMDDFLVKPLDPAALRAVLAKAISGGWTNARQDAKLAS
jgi:CheY-like chemotaxis protein